MDKLSGRLKAIKINLDKFVKKIGQSQKMIEMKFRNFCLKFKTKNKLRRRDHRR